MPYELRLAKQAQADLAEYVAGFSDDAATYLAVIDQIEAALNRLASNPRLAVARRSPFSRPTYVFEIRAQNGARTANGDAPISSTRARS